MRLFFTKMHGTGNDYIFFDCLRNEIGNPSLLAKNICRYHFSIGADGIVLISKSDCADAKMTIFNSDGSEGMMCGNAIRCVAKYLYEKNIVCRNNIEIETKCGIKFLNLFIIDNKVRFVSVDMGIAEFRPTNIPINSDKPIIDYPIGVSDKIYRITALSVGNPHCVIYSDNTDKTDVKKEGPILERNPVFPDRCNVEFAQIIDTSHIKMRVWERGSGETFSCGTGACAVVASSVKNGLVSPEREITVSLPGGQLKVFCSAEYRLTLYGDCNTICEGEFEYEDKDE